MDITILETRNMKIVWEMCNINWTKIKTKGSGRKKRDRGMLLNCRGKE